jgi:cytochrome c6
MRVAASTLIASAALFAGPACGTDETRDRAPDDQRQAERSDEANERKPATAAPSGKRIFIQRCGSCHTLADAGTTGTVGPDLDEHFGAHHMPHVAEIRDTIRNGPGRMPANRVMGRDARAVAKYVANAARE